MKYLFTLFFLMAFASCSTQIYQPGKLKMTSYDTGVKSFSKADFKKLDELVKQARVKGKNAIEFLAGDLYIKAADASLRGESETSSKIFERLIVLKPKDLYIKKRFAVELIRLNQLQRAKKMLIVVYEKDQTENIGLILAGVKIALKEPKGARRIYAGLLKRFPKSEEACVFLAKSYSLEYKFKKAYSILNSCQKNNPKKAIFTHYKGKIEINRGRFQRASRYFKKAIKIDPRYEQSVISLGVYYEEKKDLKKAAQVYRRHLKVRPSSYAVLKSIVQIYFAEGKFKRVIPYAERLSNLDPTNLNLKVRLGILYAEEKRYGDAKGIFKEVLTSVPTSDKILYYLGTLYQQTDELENAIKYFSRIDPSSSLFHESNIQVGHILQAFARSAIQKGKSTLASGRFIRFVKDKSQKYIGLRVELSMQLATFFEESDQVSRAIDVMKSITSEKVYDEEHDYYLASLLEKRNRFAEAKKVIESILQKNPHNPHALNFLGYSLLERGQDLEKSFELIKKAVELRPKDGYIRDSLAWFYYKTGKLEKALREIKIAFKYIKTDVVITKHFAQIYMGLKKYKLAKKFYVEALRNCKVESERQDVIKDLSGLEHIRLPASE